MWLNVDKFINGLMYTYDTFTYLVVMNVKNTSMNTTHITDVCYSLAVRSVKLSSLHILVKVFLF